MDIRLIYCFVLAFVAAMAVFYVTKSLIKWKMPMGILFYLIFIFHETFCAYRISSGSILRLEWAVMTVGMVFLLIFGQQERHIWNCIYFLANVLLMKVFCNVGKFVFLAFLCGFDMNRVFAKMNGFGADVFLLYFLLYIPSAPAAVFFWKSMQNLQRKFLHFVSAIMAAASLGVGQLEEWKEIVVVMPTILTLLFLVVLYRIEKENEREQQLYYHQELERQMLEKDEELEEIRKEVQRYYEKVKGSGKEEYHAQVLQKIEEAKMGSDS